MGLVFFSESRGGDVEELSVFCDGSSGEVFYAGLGELLADFVVT